MELLTLLDLRDRSFGLALPLAALLGGLFLLLLLLGGGLGNRGVIIVGRGLVLGLAAPAVVVEPDLVGRNVVGCEVVGQSGLAGVAKSVKGHIVMRL